MLRDLAFRLSDIGVGTLQWARNLPRRLKRTIYFLFNDIRVARGTVITGGSTIGRRTRINAASHLDRCDIGSYCAIGGRLIVRGANHRTEFLNMQDYAQQRVIGSRRRVAGAAHSRVRIGNAVWIGDSVIILAGVEVGDGAVIGAGSVVTKSIPPFAIAVGVPAKVVRYRFPEETVRRLISLRWWDWDDSLLRAHRWLFETDFSQPIDADMATRLDALIGAAG